MRTLRDIVNLYICLFLFIFILIINNDISHFSDFQSFVI